MLYTLTDSAGIVLGALACGLLMLLPAYAIGHAFKGLGFRRLPLWGSLSLALLFAYAFLPIIDSLLARQLGLDATLIVHLALAAAGLHALRHKAVTLPSPLWLGLAGLWLAVIIATWVDIDWNGRLYPSLVMIDAVKHAATVSALVESNAAPPLDPFFLRSEPAGYYYFYYIVSALALKLTGHLIDARAAFAGQIFWTGLALASLVHWLLRVTRLGGNATARARHFRVAMLLMGVGGLQLLPVLVIGAITGVWLAQVNWWNDQVTSWPLSLIWVPHHIAGLIAGWTALMLLASVVARLPRNATTAELSGRGATLACAGLALASAAGLSLWVTFAFAIAVAAWLIVLVAERRLVAALAVVLAGLIGLSLASVYLAGLVINRTPDAFPIAFGVRPFPFTDMLFEDNGRMLVARILVLPFSYAIEFGLFALGALLYWFERRRAGDTAGAEARRVLLITGLTGLLIASFLRSTIVNNDLAWRAVLLAQMAALLYSVVTLPRLFGTFGRVVHAPALVRAGGVAAVLGIAAVAYDLAGMRLFQALDLKGQPDMRRDAAVDYDMRRAYAWLSTHATGGVVQHNPDAERAFGYGLYSRARVAVSDRHNGRLFGASAPAVMSRVETLSPVFSGSIGSEEAGKRLAKYSIDAIVLTSSDPVWSDRTAWVWRREPLFASAHVRIIPVREATP